GHSYIFTIKGVGKSQALPESGFRISFNILTAKSFDSKEGKEVLKLLGRISSEADMTSAPALEKLLSLESELKLTPQSLLEKFVKELINSDETDFVEFKEALSIPRVPNEKNSSAPKSIEYQTLKCIAAFLNSEGGHLLLGVDDSGNIMGVEREVNANFQGSYDKFYRHIQTIIKDRLGSDASRLTEIKPCSINDKRIIVINVTPASRPIELKSKFFIRKFAKCEALSEETLKDYIKERFPI
ncbi:MAG: ATP-binding protein, partial [Idiomarina sp.]